MSGYEATCAERDRMAFLIAFDRYVLDQAPDPDDVLYFRELVKRAKLILDRMALEGGS